MKPKIEIFKSKTSKHPWCFRIKGKNGEIIAQSEGYTSKQNAQEGALAAWIALSNWVYKGIVRIEPKKK